MKNDTHREILDDLYGAPGTGPDCDAVLGMLRTHRAARRRRRNAGAALLLLALLAPLSLLRDTTPPAKPHVAANPPPQMGRIDDDQLLDMLDGQEAAIVTLPDGSKRLLLVVKVNPKERPAKSRGG